MSEAQNGVVSVPSSLEAGDLIRHAREAAELSIETLAAQLKVSTRKLELLESNAFDELPDATFARALAQAVCRQLKVDPVPVLAKLPAPGTPSRLEPFTQGLNTPFRDTGERRLPDLSFLAKPWILASGVLFVGALALYLSPLSAGKVRDWLAPSSAASVASQSIGNEGEKLAESVQVPSEPVEAASVAVVAPATAPVPDQGRAAVAEASSASAPIVPPVVAASVPAVQGAAAGSAGQLVLAVSEASWVEVRDAGGQILLSRMVKAGEKVELDVKGPASLKIGNARGTKALWRGQPIDFGPMTPGRNVARLELK